MTYLIESGIILTYSLVGLLLMLIGYLVVDLLTPGKLGDIVHDPKMHPAVWVNASAHVGIAVVMLAAIL